MQTASEPDISFPDNNACKEQFVKVTVKKSERGIPIKGWDNVCAALTLYSTGTTNNSRSTQDQQLDTMYAQSGAMGVGLLLLTQVNQEPDEFVKNMLKEAKKYLKHHDSWNASYDYDGQGVFFKTSVDITILDRKNEQYLLEINAAYVGDRPEISLAEYLQIPRSLLHTEVEIETKPLDEQRFIFNFDEILHQLTPIFHTSFSGINVARYFVRKVDDSFESQKPFLIYKEGDLSVFLSPKHVGRRFQYKNKKSTSTWKIINGSCLTGQLYEVWHKEGPQYESPSFAFRIFEPSGDFEKNIIDEETKKKINDLAEKIALCYK